jgi:NADH-quinone oxidoreductase subunit L
VAFSTLNHMFEWIQGQPDMILQSGTFAGWSVQGVLLFAGLFLFVGATGKSAQIPLFTWLPDAMAGPTPVSALIHAATMVTAGVYMCARMSHLYALIPAAGAVIALVGAATALLAASIALTQRDIKKVLAYSTVSQLGYMFIGIGVGAYAAAIFHVVTHAFFKALLFLGAGAVIHALGGHQGSKQDMHKDMGGLRKHLPVAHITMLLATLAIAGWPFFMSGAVSKDDILFNAGAGMIGADNGFQWAYGVAFVLGLIGAAFTAFYMFRLMALTFWGDYRGDPASVAHARAHGRDGWINVPLIVLAILSVIGGAINLPANWTGTTGLLYDFLHHTVAHSPVEGLHENYGWLEWTLQGSLFIGLALVIAASIHLYTRKPDTLRRWSEAGMGARLHAATSGAWGIDAFYRRYIVTPIVYLAEILYFIVDVVIIDGIIIGGLSLIAELVAGGARKIQSGQVNAYVLAIAGGGLVVLAYLLWTMLP